MDTVIVFGADSWVLVVEESVGAVAARVQTGLRLLCNTSVLAI